MAPLSLNAKVDALTLSEPNRSAASAEGVSTPTPDALAPSTDATGLLPTPTIKQEAPRAESKPTTTKKVFRCTFPGCGREFQLKGNLKRHANIHCGDKKFACKFCGKKFLRKADMEVHYRVHTGEKPYQCKYQECGKCFARRSDLLSHERTHTGRKPFACPFPGCERSFARKFDLHKHQRLHENQPSAVVKTVAVKAKTKKRRLSPVKADAAPVASETKSCGCPSDVSAAFEESIGNPEPLLNADVLVPASVEAKTPIVQTTTGCIGTRFKMSPSTPACLDAPRPMRYELKCSENHIHSPPACFAAITSLDAFMLSQETLDLSRPLGLEAFPPHRPSTSMAASCCPAHLELRPPPPEADATSAAPTTFNEPDILDQLFTTFPTSATSSRTALDALNPSTTEVVPVNNVLLSTAPSSTVSGQAVNGSSMDQGIPVAMVSQDGSGLAAALSTTMVLNSTAANVNPAPLTTPTAATASIGFGCSPGSGSTDQSSDSASDSPAVVPRKNKRSAEKACLTMPTSSLLDYSRHKRGCGHLSIQHGNHHDYVVQNHLVCQDSITSLGALQRASTTKTESKAANAPTRPCVSPQDTHRPGCGHLPVRHKDHIDYVVEDNLICQEASWLEDDNLELLGDDFWDFYGAIDAFPTN